jgi:hypothetical protein
MNVLNHKERNIKNLKELNKKKDVSIVQDEMLIKRLHIQVKDKMLEINNLKKLNEALQNEMLLMKQSEMHY